MIRQGGRQLVETEWAVVAVGCSPSFAVEKADVTHREAAQPMKCAE